MDEKVRQVITEINIGIAIHTAAFAMLGAFLMRPYLPFVLGLVLGAGVAILSVYWLYEDLERALALPSDKAKNFVTFKSILRLLTRLIVMIGAWFLGWTCFTGAVVGLLSTKVSGLLHTLISKKITHTYVPGTPLPEDTEEDEEDDEVYMTDLEARLTHKFGPARYERKTKYQQHTNVTALGDDRRRGEAVTDKKQKEEGI